MRGGGQSSPLGREKHGFIKGAHHERALRRRHSMAVEKNRKTQRITWKAATSGVRGSAPAFGQLPLMNLLVSSAVAPISRDNSNTVKYTNCACKRYSIRTSQSHKVTLYEIISMSKYLPLGIPKPSMAKNIPNWFMDGWGGEQNVSEASAEQLVVKCKAGGVGSSAGVTFNAKPYNVFPRDYAAVQFDVYVEPKFEFVKGGKFGLGLTWGPEKASGGKWQAGSGSFRVMWRENGDVIGGFWLYAHHHHVCRHDVPSGVKRVK
jgi:hypothetical protein